MNNIKQANELGTKGLQEVCNATSLNPYFALTYIAKKFGGADKIVTTIFKAGDKHGMIKGGVLGMTSTAFVAAGLNRYNNYQKKTRRKQLIKGAVFVTKTTGKYILNKIENVDEKPIIAEGVEENSEVSQSNK